MKLRTIENKIGVIMASETNEMRNVSGQTFQCKAKQKQGTEKKHDFPFVQLDSRRIWNRNWIHK